MIIMKNMNSDKRENQLQQSAANNESISQEELLNLDELFDVQGGIDRTLRENCGLGCFTGVTMPDSTGDQPVQPAANE